MWFKQHECEAVSERLWNYAAGRLPAAETEQVERHLHRCKRCANEAAEFRQTVTLLTTYRDRPTPDSEATWSQLRSRLETPATANAAGLLSPTRRVSWFGLEAALAGFALLALAAGIGGVLRHNHAVEIAERTPDVRPAPFRFDTRNSTVRPHIEQAKSLPKECPPEAPKIVRAEAQAPVRSCRRYHRRHSLPTHPTTPALANKSQPSEAEAVAFVYSVDGDRPVEQETPREFVISAIICQDDVDPLASSVLGGEAANAANSEKASQNANDKELQPW